MRNLLIIFLSWCFTSNISAQKINYDAASIPENLKAGADVVKRFERREFVVADVDKASLKVHEVMTVLKEEGRSALIFNEYTSKLMSLADADITVYDAAGKKLNHYKRKDLSFAATGDGLIEDGYVTYFMVPVSTYPVTVEYEYELRFKGTLFYPSYQVLRPDESVENSSLLVKAPKELGLRFREKNITLKPKISEDDKNISYEWSVQNLAAIKYEEDGGNYENQFPMVQLAPNRFYIYGTEGDLSSWKNFGQWINKLYEGTDELPIEKQNFLRDLVKDATSEKEKVRILYEYLQKNFRYVSIQLGIGGFKPFSASFTDSKKFGDCKALTNYMRAALKAVNIKSNVAIINAEYDRLPVDADFPTNNFNHVILCVPQPKDSIWLECTSKTNEFGVLGSFTENRNALLITDDGGVLIPTPRSNFNANKLHTSSVIVFDEKGKGKINSTFDAKGEYKERIASVLAAKSDDQKEFIVYGLGYKSPDRFAFKKEDGSTSLEMEIDKIQEFTSGTKMFFKPRVFKLWRTKLPKADARRSDYYFRFPFERTDTTVFKLSDQFEPEALPEPKKLSNAYAEFSTAYHYDEKEKAVYSVSTLVVKQMKIPASGYKDLNKLFEDMFAEDTQRIVIRRKQ